MQLEKFTLLYVEDDTTTQSAVSVILEDEVKELYIASNGQEGLALYKEHHPDIILTDINMPIMNGLEMIEQIKKINYYQKIAVLTAFDDTNNLKTAVNLGVDKYIVKPLINEDKLLEPLNDIAYILQIYNDKQRLEKLLVSQSKMAAMGEMIANIAHQWRQPLAIISSEIVSLQLKIQLERDISNSFLESLGNGVSSQVQFLSNTIDDFRNFFIEKDYNETEQFPLLDCIKKATNLLDSTFQNNYIQVISDIKNDIVIQNNENKLIQVFINIFNNMKDAFESKDINIEQRYIFIEVIQEETFVNIIIKDSAGGIEKDILSRVFEPYFTTKHQSQGTGLGLYMSYEIITKSFSGIIDVKNTEYKFKDESLKGALFEIKI